MNFNSFVIKVNHGSGGVIIVGDFPQARVLPFFLVGNSWPKFLVDKKSLKKPVIKRFLRHWMKHSYENAPNKFPEWAYGQVKPSIFIEEYLKPSGIELIPKDYKNIIM